jgi:hypothetical protein
MRAKLLKQVLNSDNPEHSARRSKDDRLIVCQSLHLIFRPPSDCAIHPTASIIGEAGSILSRMRSTGFAGASAARVLDRIDPLAKLAAKR